MASIEQPYVDKNGTDVYKPTKWIDDVPGMQNGTPLDEVHMNNIEGGINSASLTLEFAIEVLRKMGASTESINSAIEELSKKKQDSLVSGTNIKTINGESLLGKGNIFIKGGTLSSEVTAAKADILKGKTTVTSDSNDQIATGTLEVQSIINFNMSLYASETVMGAWQNPVKGPYSGVKVVYRTDRYPNTPDDGSLAYEGSAISFTKKLSPNVKHYFSAFSYMTTNYGRFYRETPSKAEFTPTTVKGREVFRSSTTWTVPTAVRSVEVFLVGGGGAGGGRFERQNGDDLYLTASGGGGGYTKTQTVSVSPGQNISVIVGAGGIAVKNGAGNSGGTSSFGSVSVSGGSGGNTYNGGNGGSGGGVAGKQKWGGNGGSDGSDGKKESTAFGTVGTGQHTTTKDWDGTLYAGGGGGGGSRSNDGYHGGSGGAGGGGNGCDGGYSNSGYNAGAGTANTGGGGGGSGDTDPSKGSSGGPSANGGSGIVIVRWGY